MKMRKGFTLVELLIVIVIIGVLAAAMLLSSGSATASAEASNIITNLRGLKAAALMLYADSMDDFNKANPETPTIADAAKYMDNPGKVKAGGYSIEVDTTDKTKWFIKADLSSTGLNVAKDVKEKLMSRRESVGLYKAATAPAPEKGDYDGGDTVCMVAR